MLQSQAASAVMTLCPNWHKNCNRATWQAYGLGVSQRILGEHLGIPEYKVKIKKRQKITLKWISGARSWYSIDKAVGFIS